MTRRKTPKLTPAQRWALLQNARLLKIVRRKSWPLYGKSVPLDDGSFITLPLDMAWRTHDLVLTYGFSPDTDSKYLREIETNKPHIGSLMGYGRDGVQVIQGDGIDSATGLSLIHFRIPIPNPQSLPLQRTLTQAARLGLHTPGAVVIGECQDDGKPYIFEFGDSTPHAAVVCGSGVGGSSTLRTALASIMHTSSPDKHKFIIFDPKGLPYDPGKNPAFYSLASTAWLYAPIMHETPKLLHVLRELGTKLESREALPYHVIVVLDDAARMIHTPEAIQIVKKLDDIGVVGRSYHVHILARYNELSADVLKPGQGAGQGYQANLASVLIAKGIHRGAHGSFVASGGYAGLGLHKLRGHAAVVLHRDRGESRIVVAYCDEQFFKELAQNHRGRPVITTLQDDLWPETMQYLSLCRQNGGEITKGGLATYLNKHYYSAVQQFELLAARGLIEPQVGRDGLPLQFRPHMVV